jgi:Divalent cation transporter
MTTSSKRSVVGRTQGLGPLLRNGSSRSSNSNSSSSSSNGTASTNHSSNASVAVLRRRSEQQNLLREASSPPQSLVESLHQENEKLKSELAALRAELSRYKSEFPTCTTTTSAPSSSIQYDCIPSPHSLESTVLSINPPKHPKTATSHLRRHSDPDDSESTRLYLDFPTPDQKVPHTSSQHLDSHESARGLKHRRGLGGAAALHQYSPLLSAAVMHGTLEIEHGASANGWSLASAATETTPLRPKTTNSSATTPYSGNRSSGTCTADLSRLASAPPTSLNASLQPSTTYVSPSYTMPTAEPYDVETATKLHRNGYYESILAKSLPSTPDTVPISLFSSSTRTKPIRSNSSTESTTSTSSMFAAIGGGGSSRRAPSSGTCATATLGPYSSPLRSSSTTTTIPAPLLLPSFGAALSDRAGWLVGLLVLQSLSSFIIARNEVLLQNHLVIVRFLTMLVGAGGNAGNQASVGVIRGLATGLIRLHRTSDHDDGHNNDVVPTRRSWGSGGIRATLQRELLMAAGLSLILGVAGALRAALFLTPATETVAIAVCLVAIVFISVLLGAILPLAMKCFQIDPAHSSTTIQVVMDILGVLITVRTYCCMCFLCCAPGRPIVECTRVSLTGIELSSTPNAELSGCILDSQFGNWIARTISF